MTNYWLFKGYKVEEVITYAGGAENKKGGSDELEES